MFFRSPSQNGNNEYFPQNEPILQNTQRVIFNNSFTVHSRPGIQEKLFQNFQHQTLNPPHLNIAVRTDQNIMVEESRQRPVSFYKSPRHGQTTLTRGYSHVEGSQIPIQHQLMMLRNQRAQMSEKMRRIKEELFHRDNIIKIREKEILELKHVNSQPMIFKTNSYEKIPQFKSDKHKMDFQTTESNDLIRSLQEKIQNIQKENGLLSLKYQELLSKSSFDTGRKIKREQSQQYFSLAKSQRLNAELEKQVLDLKQKVKELQDQNTKNSTQSSVFNYSVNNFSELLGASRSNSNKDFHSSNFELEKLQNQIKQKNEMIKYLQVQCLRESQSKGSEQDYSKINRQKEQWKKQIGRMKKQVQILKFENESLTQKITKFENQTEQVRRKNRRLELLNSELKEQSKNSENRTKAQKQSYESKIQQLSGLLIQNSSNACKQSSQIESGIKKYELLLCEVKTKSAMQLNMKDKIIKEQQQQKSKLIDKMADYQLEIKNKNLTICAYEDQIAKAKFNEQFRKLSEKKITDQNVQSIQTQLKTQIQIVSQLQLANKFLGEQCENMKRQCSKEVESLKQMLIICEQKQKVCEQSLLQRQLEFTKIIKAYEQKLQINSEKQRSQFQGEKAQKQQKERLMDEINKSKQIINGFVKGEQNLKKQLAILHEAINQKDNQICLGHQNRNQIQFQNAKLLQKVRELTDFIQILKSSISTKQKQMTKLQQKIQINSKLSQMVIGFESKLKEKDQQIERMQMLGQKLNQTIAESSKRDKQRELLEMQKQEQFKKQGLKICQKQQIVEQMNSQIQKLICDQKQKEMKIKVLEQEIEERNRQSQIHIQHQNQLLLLRTESIVQTQQIKAIRKILTTKQVTQNQYRTTLEQKLKSIFQLELQLKTVKDSLKTVVEQFQEYKLQQQMQLSLKQETPLIQSLSSRSKAKSIKSLGTQENFSDKGNDGESFIADFIEIDRNALLYICDLLSIVPSEGEVLKNIIEHIEQSPQSKSQRYYQQVLELFGVQTGFCEQTHMNLICSIKQYRMTISALIEKMDLLEKRVDIANKENRTLGKELDFKNKQNNILGNMVVGLNGDIVRMGVKRMSQKYGRTQSMEVKEIVGDVGKQDF